MRTHRLALLAAIAAAPSYAASAVTLVGPSLSPGMKSIVVTLAKPRPTLNAVTPVNLWQVVVRQPGNSLGILIPLTSIEDAFATHPGPLTYATTGQVRLNLAAPLATVPDTIDITLALDKPPATATWKNKKPGVAPTRFQDPIGFFPVSGKSAADMYLYGDYVGGVGSKPAYDLDTVVGSPNWIPGRVPQGSEVDKRLYTVSLVGEAATSSKPSFDPDCFSASISLARRYPAAIDSGGRSYWDFKWKAADLEFSSVNRAFDFVTAPTFIYDIGGVMLRPDRTVRATVNLDLFGGLELGENLQNKIVAGSYGGIARLVPGAAVYFVFPKALGLKEIDWTSDYRDRILATEEPFIDTRGTPRAYLARGSRHRITNTITFQLNEFIGISVKHEYGSLPPSFTLIDNKVTIGVTTMWSWKSAK
jgi:hypothetical protein